MNPIAGDVTKIYKQYHSIREQIKKFSQPPLKVLNGENFAVQQYFQNINYEHYKTYLGDIKTLIIDEAQAVPNIGRILKFVVDSFPQITVFITGSSAFDLERFTGEPLTGRQFKFLLYPFSQPELNQIDDPIYKAEKIQQRLIYGSYPEVALAETDEEKQMILKDILSSYLLKDILKFERIKNASKIYDLLRLLAYQVGNEVSLNNLSKELGINKKTVERYLVLLSKVFVIYNLEGFSRNLRKEIRSSAKWYFYDNGIRNALIMDFKPLDMRNDTGQLWENFVITERRKYLEYHHVFWKQYFWRTYDKQEIDLVEEVDGDILAYEIKWKTDKFRIPQAWETAYPDYPVKPINLQDFVLWTLDTKPLTPD